MMRYFKREIPAEDTELGVAGTSWIEFDGDHSTREVERHGERRFSSPTSTCPVLAEDSPISRSPR